MTDKPKMPSFTRYRFHRLGSHDWSPDYPGDDLVNQIRNRASEKGEWQIQEVSMTAKWGPLRAKPDMIQTLEKKLRNGDVGITYLFRPADMMPTWVVRKVHIKPDVMDTAGTRAVDVAHTAVVEKFKGQPIQSWGICNIRPIGGTTTWSQHAYCNAEDWHSTPAIMSAIASYLVSNAGKLNVHTVIYNHRIWTKAEGWHPYTGDNPHTDHVHVDFDPWGKGDPRK